MFDDLDWDEILNATIKFFFWFLVTVVLVVLLTTLFAGCTKANDLPDMPRPKAILIEHGPGHPNRLWLTETVVLGGLHAADLTLTSKGLGQPCPSWSGCRMQERDWVYGHHPGNARLGLTAAAIFIGESLVLHKTERSRHWPVRWGGRAFFAVTVADEIRAIRTWTH